MRKLMILSILLMSFLVPSATHAQFSFGARLGYAVPGGEYVADVDQADLVGSMIPIQLELGYSITPSFNLGAYFSYGFGALQGDVADACEGCSLSGIRLGLQGVYSFNAVSQNWIPWVGLGLGYEILDLWTDAGAGSNTDRGWEFLNLQAGVDYKAGKMRIGPFLSYAFGQYLNYEGEGPTGEYSGDYEETGTHTWLTLGIRCQFGG